MKPLKIFLWGQDNTPKDKENGLMLIIDISFDLHEISKNDIVDKLIQIN